MQASCCPSCSCCSGCCWLVMADAGPSDWRRLVWASPLVPPAQSPSVSSATEGVQYLPRYIHTPLYLPGCFCCHFRYIPVPCRLLCFPEPYKRHAKAEECTPFLFRHMPSLATCSLCIFSANAEARQGKPKRTGRHALKRKTKSGM